MTEEKCTYPNTHNRGYFNNQNLEPLKMFIIGEQGSVNYSIVAI